MYVSYVAFSCLSSVINEEFFKFRHFYAMHSILGTHVIMKSSTSLHPRQAG